jgi:hypothetical protein
VAGVPGELAELIHDDFRGVETDGSIVTKEEEIHILSNMNFAGGKISEDIVMQHDKFLVVIGRAFFQTEGPEVHYRFTDIFVQGKLICSHVTQLS